MSPVLPAQSIPIRNPFDPKATGPVPFGKVTDLQGRQAEPLVFAPGKDGFTRFTDVRDARTAAFELLKTVDTAHAVQMGRDGAYYLGEVRREAQLAPVHFATQGLRFEQPQHGAGDVIDDAYFVSFGNFSDRTVPAPDPVVEPAPAGRRSREYDTAPNGRMIPRTTGYGSPQDDRDAGWMGQVPPPSAWPSEPEPYTPPARDSSGLPHMDDPRIWDPANPPLYG